VKRLADQTLYEILEVRADAAHAEIEAALERALALYGPGSLAMYTLMAPEESELLGRRLEEARSTLLDGEARARYDELVARTGEACAGPAPAVSPPGELPPVIAAAHAAEPPRAAAAPPRPTPPPLPAPPAAAPPSAAEPAAPTPASPPARTPPPILLHREVVAAPPPAAPRTTPPPELAARPPLPMLPDGAPWTGEVLRQVREARGISVQQIAERTRVTRHHIENIEGDRFPMLPAAVYLRGILLSLARELRLDGQRVARSYLDRVAAASAKGR
jgi:hypothetical protein